MGDKTMKEYNKKYNEKTKIWDDRDFSIAEEKEKMKDKLEKKKISYEESFEGIFIQEKDLIEAKKK